MVKNLKTVVEHEDYDVINIKAENKAQIFSKYSYDANDKLNPELSNYIIEKTNRLNPKKDLKLNFYVNEEISQQEVKTIINNHFKEDYLEYKTDFKKALAVISIFLLLGVVALITLTIMNYLFNNFYFNIILEIVAWVFVWEAVDITFFRIPKLKRKTLQMQRICNAKIEIVKD